MRFRDSFLRPPEPHPPCARFILSRRKNFCFYPYLFFLSPLRGSSRSDRSLAALVDPRLLRTPFPRRSSPRTHTAGHDLIQRAFRFEPPTGVLKSLLSSFLSISPAPSSATLRSPPCFARAYSFWAFALPLRVLPPPLISFPSLSRLFSPRSRRTTFWLLFPPSILPILTASPCRPIDPFVCSVPHSCRSLQFFSEPPPLYLCFDLF